MDAIGRSKIHLFPASGVIFEETKFGGTKVNIYQELWDQKTKINPPDSPDFTIISQGNNARAFFTQSRIWFEQGHVLYWARYLAFDLVLPHPGTITNDVSNKMQI